MVSFTAVNNSVNNIFVKKDRSYINGFFYSG